MSSIRPAPEASIRLASSIVVAMISSIFSYLHERNSFLFSLPLSGFSLSRNNKIQGDRLLVRGTLIIPDFTSQGTGLIMITD
jgi:hypothetical protein